MARRFDVLNYRINETIYLMKQSIKILLSQSLNIIQGWNSQENNNSRKTIIFIKHYEQKLIII